MKKLTYILITSLALTACTNSERESRDIAAEDTTLELLDTTNKAQVYTADVDLSGNEKVFLLNAALSTQRITTFAHLAAQRANDNALKAQAKKIEIEYNKMLGDLQSLAKGKGVLLTRNEPADELKTLEKEQGLSFDQLYIKLILFEHANLVQQLDNGIKLSNDDIKNFANNSLLLVNKNNSDIAKILK